MTLHPPPRHVGLSAYGFAAYGFLTALVLAMLLGPLISFVVEDGREEVLLERGVLTRFDMTASEATRGGHRIAYSFQVPQAAGAARSLIGHSVLDEGEYAAFAEPENRFVLYDPIDPDNFAPVPSRAALARSRIFDRKVAILAYPTLAAVILSLSSIGVWRLRRTLRLLRFGFAAIPTLTQPIKSKPCVDFAFVDADGDFRRGHRCFNFRLGIGADFSPFTRDAVVFSDPRDPRIFELFLPEIATFRFQEV